MKKARVMDDKLRGRLEWSGLKIAFYRKQRGLTQDELAERMDVSRSFLARVEACSGSPPQVPPIAFYYNVADALDVPMTKIVDDQDR